MFAPLTSVRLIVGLTQAWTTCRIERAGGVGEMMLLDGQIGVDER